MSQVASQVETAQGSLLVRWVKLDTCHYGVVSWDATWRSQRFALNLKILAYKCAGVVTINWI